MNHEYSEYEEQLDAVLRSIGTETPDPGMEGRILTRLAAARIEAGTRRLHLRVPRFVAPVAGFVSAGLVCGVIVVGSVRHSHQLHPGAPVAPPVVLIQGAGVGAASAVHPANPGTAAPVPATPTARGRASHRTVQRGRARIAPHAKKAPGVAVPAPPQNPEP